MFEDKRLLLVDDSRTVVELLRTLLEPTHREVLRAGDVAQARCCIDETPGLDLVLCDMVLPDGTGFDVLAHARAGVGPRPEVMLMTARVSEADRERAVREGALGYLSKPIVLPDIRRAWSERAERRPIQPRAPRRSVMVRVEVADPGAEASILCVTALDVSRSGAFLAMPGPLPLGTKLDLTLELDDARVRVLASVVRVQEPGWMSSPGLGVHFDEVAEDSRDAFDRFVAS